MKVTDRARNVFSAVVILMVATIGALHFRDWIVEPTMEADAYVWAKDRLPLKVSRSKDLAWADDAFNTAIVEINRLVGCEVLTHDSEAPDVRFSTLGESNGCMEGEGFVQESGAGTRFCRDGTADSVVHNPTHIREAHVIFKHEFGHVFGLKHDPSGLMATKIARTEWMDPYRPLPMLSGKDVRAIRERYCR